jgi:hypothetical protein
MFQRSSFFPFSYAAASFSSTPTDDLCFVWSKEPSFLHLLNCLYISIGIKSSNDCSCLIPNHRCWKLHFLPHLGYSIEFSTRSVIQIKCSLYWTAYFTIWALLSATTVPKFVISARINFDGNLSFLAQFESSLPSYLNIIYFSSVSTLLCSRCWSFKSRSNMFLL